MGDLLLSLNVWAVLVAAVLYFLLGALWYSLLFANVWMKLRGLNKEDMEEPDKLIFLWSFLLQLVATCVLALFLQAMEVGSASHGAVAGFGAGAGLVFTLAGSTGLFSNVKIGLHFIDNGYHVVGLTLAGVVLGAW
ncbi:MAG: DUF1761 domain-containing protein [Balneolales bacterium]